MDAGKAHGADKLPPCNLWGSRNFPALERCNQTFSKVLMITPVSASLRLHTPILAHSILLCALPRALALSTQAVAFGQRPTWIASLRE